MSNSILIFLILLSSCASPSKVKETKRKYEKILFMKPNPNLCKYRRTIKAADYMWGDEQKVWNDIYQLAHESKANVGHIIKLRGQVRETIVELFNCPDQYISKYKEENLK